MSISPQDAAAHAQTLLSARAEMRSVDPISATNPDFSMADAQAVAERILALRTAQGEHRIGRKIGFTNRTIWETYGVTGPIWGDMFDTTVFDVDAGPTEAVLPALAALRIEPEIVFGMGQTPDDPDMPLAELARCIEWVAHGFEVVSSVYPGWKQTVSDAHAACGMHGALYVGPRQPLSVLGDDPAAALAGITLTLTGGDVKATGHGRDVLDGPVSALQHLVQSLSRFGADPIAAGDVITTGTLTDAFPLAAGERWQTTIAGAPIPGLDVTFQG